MLPSAASEQPSSPERCWTGTGPKGRRTNEEGGPKLYPHLFSVNSLQQGCVGAWSNRTVVGGRKKVNRNRNRVKMVSDAPDHLLPWVLSRRVVVSVP